MGTTELEALGPLAGHPLEDTRVQVDVNDVAVTLRSTPGRFDSVGLDVDNGPSAFATFSNDRLYDNEGLAGRAHGPQERRGAGGLVRPGRSEIRTTPALCRL